MYIITNKITKKVPSPWLLLSITTSYFHFHSKSSTQINSQLPFSPCHHFHSISNYLQLKCFSHYCKLQITLCFIQHSIRRLFRIDNEKSLEEAATRRERKELFALLLINRVRKKKLFQFTIIIVVIKIRMLIDSDNFSVLTSYNIPWKWRCYWVDGERGCGMEILYCVFTHTWK